jgi:hypothetical protein
MRVNIIYDNSGTRTPSGATPNQPLAGLSSVRAYVYNVPKTAQSAIYGNPDAASVIQSNGELIGNAQLVSNPLPPGVTA